MHVLLRSGVDRRHVLPTLSGLEKTATVVCLLALVAAIYHATHLKYSPFFIRPKNFSAIVRDQEKSRDLADLKYLRNRYNQSSINDHNSCGSNEVCRASNYDIFVIFITLRRLDKKTGQQETSRYLTSSLASITRQIDSMTYGRIGLAVCDVNREPDDFIAGLSASVDLTVLSKSQQQQEQSDFARFSLVTHDNERLDYLFCLNAVVNFVTSHSTGSEFYLVAQDDAVAENNALQFLMNWREKFRGFFGVKLHFPPKWQGFSMDLRTPLELAAVFLISGSLMTFIFHGIVRRLLRISSLMSTFWRYFVIFGCFGILLCLILGRQHSVLTAKRMLNLHSLVSLSDCCLPAVLYPSKSVQLMIDGLRDIKCSKSSPFDVALADFARKFTAGNSVINFPFLEPNLFKHIGRISTLTDAKGDLDYYNL